jgi:hypothetical protein
MLRDWGLGWEPCLGPLLVLWMELWTWKVGKRIPWEPQTEEPWSGAHCAALKGHVLEREMIGNDESDGMRQLNHRLRI